MAEYVEKTVATSGVKVAKNKGRENLCTTDRWIVYGVFVLYAIFLIEGLLFKFQTNYLAIKNFTKPIEFEWIPALGWETLKNYSLSQHLEVWGNLAIFIPFGCFFAILNDKRGAWHIIDALVICSFSVFIEVCQSLFCIGMGDMRDIVLNTAGGVLGIYLYKLLRLILKKYALIVFALATAVAMVIFTLCAYTYMGGGF